MQLEEDIVDGDDALRRFKYRITAGMPVAPPRSTTECARRSTGMTPRMTTTADGDSEQTVYLPDGPRAAAVARNAKRDVLGRWRLSSVLEDVLLAVSELVTNAVLHGKPKVWLVLRRRQSRVDVAVHDDRPMPDSRMRGSRTDNAESGRGLQIVGIISDGVSFEDVPGDGKFAHASFPTTPDAPATDNGRTSRRS